MVNLGKDPKLVRHKDEFKRGEERSKKSLYAALDLGTNSCRMLIARPTGPRFEIVDAFSKSVRLGLDLERTGELSQAGIARALQALHVCSKKLKRFGVRRSRLVATEACRRSKNGRKFLSKVKRDTGLTLELIKPEEEARLAVISCAPLLDCKVSQVLIVDIGGGSTELVWIDLVCVPQENRVAAMLELQLDHHKSADTKNFSKSTGQVRIVDWISVPLGVATLLERYSDVEDDSARFALMSCDFEQQIENFLPYFSEDTMGMKEDLQIIGTSGTVTTLGAVHLGLRRYDRLKVDGLDLKAADIDAVIEKFLQLGPEGRKREPGIGRDRAELIMSGSAIMQTLLRIWPTKSMRVADRGLREGILYSLMSADNHFGRINAKNIT
ncbi:MAG: exopolyphosphatase [Rhodobacteraceae bacterium]|nr:MAG: exopolyphosphatase [Paracoccaceae bacterium]